MEKAKKAFWLKILPILLALAIMVGMILVVVSIMAEIQGAIAASVHHILKQQEEDADLENLEPFTITGNKNGTVYTMKFHFKGYNISGIKVSLPKGTKSGTLHTTVKIPGIATGSHEQMTYQYLIQKGFTPEGACGLMANINAESGFIENREEGDAAYRGETVILRGWGICQWTNSLGNPHGRRYKAIQYVKKKGFSPSAKSDAMFLAELEYALTEKGYTGIVKKVKTCTNVTEATKIWCTQWEKPANMYAAAAARAKTAKAYLKKYKNNSGLYTGAKQTVNLDLTFYPGTGVTSSGSGIAGAIAWARRIANDNSFTYGKKPGSIHRGCYFCGTNYGPIKYSKPSKKYKKTYCCNTFVFSAYAHGGGNKKMLKDCKKGNNAAWGNEWSKYGFKVIKVNGHKPPYSQLQPGDVMVHDYGPRHMWMITDPAKNLYVESSGGGWGKNSIAEKKGAKWKYKYRCHYVIRWVGGGKVSTTSASSGTDTISFNGSLNGISIAGSFYVSGKKIFGSGYYGEGAENAIITETASGGLMNPFGKKKFTITSTACRWRMCPFHGKEIHGGWDLACGGSGTPIYAVSGGNVVLAGGYGGFGSHVVIIKSGNMYVLYGHMSAMKVKKGDKVTAGQRIGSQGSEGYSTGPHLHLEFRKGSLNATSTANLSNIRPMLKKWASNYNSKKSEFSGIVR